MEFFTQKDIEDWRRARSVPMGERWVKVCPHMQGAESAVYAKRFTPFYALVNLSTVTRPFIRTIPRDALRGVRDTYWFAECTLFEKAKVRGVLSDEVFDKQRD